MTRTQFLGAAALAASASAFCAMGSPPRAAEPVTIDHGLEKQRQLAWEAANGLIPSEGGGMGLRGVCANSMTRSPNVAIPQFNVTPGVVTDQMATSGDPLLNVKVRLNIAHTWQGDVIARLRHEASGTEVTLIDRPGVPETAVGFSTDNYGDNPNAIPFVVDDLAASIYGPPAVAAGIANVTGQWLADDASFTLAAFNGLTADSAWTLTVSDNAAVDVGTLQSWTICSDNPLGQGLLGSGSASPNSAAPGGSTTVAVSVTPAAINPSSGIGVTADLSLIGGSSTQQLFDDATNGDDFGGDNVFKYTQVVAGTPGPQTVSFVVSDAQGRTSPGSFSFTIVAPGDVCSAAVPISVGASIISNNATATTDTGHPTCSGVTTTANLGLWFTVIGNGNVLNATTCSANTAFNTRVFVFTGNCGALTCVDANTIASPACSPSTAASARFCSINGQAYYILVANDTTGSGQFELSVLDEGACLANDRCSGAVGLSVPSTTIVNTAGSTSDNGPPTCTTTIVRGGVWYTVIGNGNLFVADTCDGSSGNFDTRLSVFCAGQAGSCSNLAALSCVTGIDNATLAPPNGCGSGSQQSRVQWCTQVGATYYILVHGGTGTQGASGTTTLTLADQGACTGAVSCLPVGGCCTGTDCMVTTQIGCNDASGSYLGDGTNCLAVGDSHTYTSNPNLAIPDNTCAAGYQQDSIVISDSFTIGDINVRVVIPNHTFLADLQLRLTNGVTTVLLMDEQCGTNAGMDITFDDEGAALLCAEPTVGTYRPTGVGAGPLASFIGGGIGGTWTLEYCDDAGIDTGTLASWSIIAYEAGPGPCDGPAFCDADWCQDGNKAVSDIFCFLADWFALDPAARTFGGAVTPVPAIFNFLSVWFATDPNDCLP